MNIREESLKKHYEWQGKLEITARANIKNDTCIYMDYGSEEIFNHAFTTDALISTSQLLLT